MLPIQIGCGARTRLWRYLGYEPSETLFLHLRVKLVQVIGIEPTMAQGAASFTDWEATISSTLAWRRVE